MKISRRRFVSLLLALVMALSTLPVGAFAVDMNETAEPVEETPTQASVQDDTDALHNEADAEEQPDADLNAEVLTVTEQSPKVPAEESAQVSEPAQYSEAEFDNELGDDYDDGYDDNDDGYDDNDDGYDDYEYEEPHALNGQLILGENTVEDSRNEAVYYSFTPDKEGYYIIRSARTGSECDPYAYLYGSNWAQRGEDDDQAGDMNFYLLHYMSEGETWYIKISNGEADMPVIVEALGYSGSCGENAQWSLDPETGALSITGSGELNSCPWTCMWDMIETVSIEDGITSAVGFSDLTFLKNITIPGSVRTIGDSAFFNCTNLERVTIEDGVETIEREAFSQCPNLTYVRIPASVTEMQSDIFRCSQYDDEIGNVEGVPSNLTIYGYTNSFADIYADAYGIHFISEGETAPISPLGEGAFPVEAEQGFYQLKVDTSKRYLISLSASDGWKDEFRVILYDSKMKEIDTVYNLHFAYELNAGETYYLKYMISWYELPTESLTLSIGPIPTSGEDYNGSWSFAPDTGTLTVQGNGRIDNGEWDDYYRNEIKHVILEGTVDEISYYAFYGCNQLETVVIPEGVRKIGGKAFGNCDSLKSVTIPASVTSIESGAFCHEDSYFDENDDYIDVFTPSPALTISGYTGSCAEKYANQNSIPLHSIGKIDDYAETLVDNQPSTIAFQAYETKLFRFVPSYDRFYTFTMKEGDREYKYSECQIYTEDFDYLEDDSVKLSAGEVYWIQVQNYDSEPKQFTVAMAPVPYSGSCGEGVTWSLDAKTGILTIAGNGEMDSSPWEIFCEEITGVNIQPGVYNISKRAFSDCCKLTSIEIPEGVCKIGYESFYRCNALTTVTLPASLEEIKSDAFTTDFETDDDWYWGRIPNLTIRGYSDSAAEQFALREEIPFESLGQIQFGSQNVYYGDVTGNASRVSEIAKPISKSTPETVTIGVSRANAYFTFAPDATGVYRIKADQKEAHIKVYRTDSDMDRRVWVDSGDGEVNVGLSGGVTYLVCVGSNSTATGNVNVSVSDGYTTGAFDNGLSWNYGNGTLTVSGKGEVTTAPWNPLSEIVTHLAVQDGITAFAGEGLFRNMEYLESVELPSTLTDLGSSTFAETKLTRIEIPASVKSIGEDAFLCCGELKEVVFLGSAPNMNDEAFWRDEFTAYYNPYTTGWDSAVEKDYGAVITWTKQAPLNTDITYAELSGLSDAAYTGKAIQPKVTVKLGTSTLSPETDYTVTYSNNINAGEATVTVTGKGSYTGSVSGSFTIQPASLAKATITASNKTFNGKALTSTPEVTLNGTKLSSAADYTVAYSNNIHAGKATITVQGKGNYTGTALGNFQITPLSLKKATVKSADRAYTGKNISSAPVVTLNGVTLSGKTDYTVQYKNNKELGKATVTVTGKGDYTGTASGTFTIQKGNQNLTATVASSKLIAGKTVKIVSKGVGSISYVSSNTKVATVTQTGVVKGIRPGSVTITVKAAGNAKWKAASKKLTITVYYATPSVPTVQNVNGGMKITWNKVAGAEKYRIFYKTGKGSWTKLADTTGTTYTWKKAKNGTAYAFTVRCISKDGKTYTSDYNKTGKSLTYVVTPTLSSVKNSKAKTMTASWKKLSGVTGFQIQYSTNKTFKSGNQAVMVKKKAAVSQTINKLTKGKTYYVRIRSYKTISGKNVYSAWSTAKSVKISK